MFNFIQNSKDGSFVGGGVCLCKWKTWNSEYFWLEITIQGFSNSNFVATFWSVFNITRVQNTGLFVCCISHYFQNCFIIFIHSFGFLIWNQFHPIGKQFSRQIDITAICPQLPEIGKIIRMTLARLNFLSWYGLLSCHKASWFILLSFHHKKSRNIFSQLINLESRWPKQHGKYEWTFLHLLIEVKQACLCGI